MSRWRPDLLPRIYLHRAVCHFSSNRDLFGCLINSDRANGNCLAGTAAFTQLINVVRNVIATLIQSQFEKVNFMRVQEGVSFDEQK